MAETVGARITPASKQEGVPAGKEHGTAGKGHGTAGKEPGFAGKAFASGTSVTDRTERELALDGRIRAYFQIPSQDVRTYSPLTLAYIGDGIFDLVIRSLVVGAGNTSPNKLHERTSRIVCAHSQAQMMQALTPHLRPDESVIFRRGRNAKSYTMAKNATVADYRTATGLEALMGYLYLTDQMERMLELIRLGLDRIGENYGA